MPARKNSAPQTSAISMVWPKSGCSTSPVTTTSSSPSAMVLAGISGRRADLAEQPGDQDHEGGLEELRRLDVDAEDDDPAPRALDLGAVDQRRHDQREADDEHHQRDPADVARRQERGREQHGERRDQVQHVAVDEIERLEPEPRRDRRARRQRQHDAGQHEREHRRQHQPVDRPPPGGEGRAFDARNHGPPPGADAGPSRDRRRLRAG